MLGNKYVLSKLEQLELTDDIDVDVYLTDK